MKCQYRSRKTEWVKGVRGDLRQAHLCKNKEIEFIFCEGAIRAGACSGGQVRP